MFKSQLQEYAQKAGLPAPVYDVTKEGPSHEPQFKASVTINGKVYESPSFFGNLKKAEHAAAKIALTSLGKSETGPLHDSGLCKNLLQEYAQKCKLSLPVYSVVKIGEIHSPTFSSTVEIAGVHYNGGKCKTKKEAEIKAAKTALAAIYADAGHPPLDGIDEQLMGKAEGEELAAAAAVEETSEPKPITKRKRLFKESELRKHKLKEGQTENADEVGGKGTVVDGTKQANGSSAPGSTSQAPEQELVGSAADSCTAVITKISSCANGSAQEQQA